jgi:CTP-dependent riboflavin kinase
MGYDYREYYCKELKVSLKREIASIHHIDSNNKNRNIKNLVAIPQGLHDRINITFNKFPVILKNIMKTGNYFLVKEKYIKELEKYLQDYKDLLRFIAIKKTIQCVGLEKAREWYKESIDLIYDS